LGVKRSIEIAQILQQVLPKQPAEEPDLTDGLDEDQDSLDRHDAEHHSDLDPQDPDSAGGR
jgi:hypothetical protein